MLLRSAIIAATLTALPTGAALAQDAKTTDTGNARLGAIFTERDTDNDGRITREEMTAFRTKMFGSADADSDGALDSAELATHARSRIRSRMESRFESADANEDGKLTLDEMPHPYRLFFFRIDKDLDGAVTKEEMREAAERRLRRRMYRMVWRMDVDKNGKISKNEFIDAGNRFFRRFDRNDDDTVTREEAAATMKRWQEHRGRHHRMGHKRHGWKGHHRMGERGERGERGDRMHHRGDRRGDRSDRRADRREDRLGRRDDGDMRGHRRLRDDRMYTSPRDWRDDRWDSRQRRMRDEENRARGNAPKPDGDDKKTAPDSKAPEGKTPDSKNKDEI